MCYGDASSGLPNARARSVLRGLAGEPPAPGSVARNSRLSFSRNDDTKKAQTKPRPLFNGPTAAHSVSRQANSTNGQAGPGGCCWGAGGAGKPAAHRRSHQQSNWARKKDGWKLPGAPEHTCAKQLRRPALPGCRARRGAAQEDAPAGCLACRGCLLYARGTRTQSQPLLSSASEPEPLCHTHTHTHSASRRGPKALPPCRRTHSQPPRALVRRGAMPARLGGT